MKQFNEFQAYDTVYIADGLTMLLIVVVKIWGEFFPASNILMLATMIILCLMIAGWYYGTTMVARAYNARTYTNSELRTLLYYRLMLVVYLSIVPVAQNYIGPGAFMPPVPEIMDIILSIMFNLFFAYLFYMLSWVILRHIIKPVWRYASAIHGLKDIPYPLC